MLANVMWQPNITRTDRGCFSQFEFIPRPSRGNWSGRWSSCNSHWIGWLRNYHPGQVPPSKCRSRQSSRVDHSHYPVAKCDSLQWAVVEWYCFRTPSLHLKRWCWSEVCWWPCKTRSSSNTIKIRLCDISFNCALGAPMNARIWLHYASEFFL
jgi:hypothetical protein